jgi:hypothetical protein
MPHVTITECRQRAIKSDSEDHDFETADDLARRLDKEIPQQTLMLGLLTEAEVRNTMKAGPISPGGW